MKRIIKTFVFLFFSVMLLAFFGSIKTARCYHEIFHLPSFHSQPLLMPTTSPITGDILIDNFEYWDSPYNHYWTQLEPPYPVYGFGIGYALVFNTILDLQRGSRVLNVYRPMSVFLLGTMYELHGISKDLLTPPSNSTPLGDVGIDLDKNGILSFDFRAPLGIEPWDIFQCTLRGYAPGSNHTLDDPIGSVDDILVTIIIKPVQPPYNAFTGQGSNLDEFRVYQASLESRNAQGITIVVDIGRGFLDGTWHTIWLDLKEVQDMAYEASRQDTGSDSDDNGFKDAPAREKIRKVFSIEFQGRMFRADNIIFRDSFYHRFGDYPYIFRMGPLYAQLYEPYRFLFVADYAGAGHPGTSISEERVIDLMLNIDNFITDTNTIIDTWLQDSNVNGVIQMDPNYLDPNHPSYGRPEPYYSGLLGRDFIIDIALPVFSDPNVRINGSLGRGLREEGHLGWNATIGGYGAQGIESFLVQPLRINPYDGMPTYMPSFYISIEVIKTFGKPFYPPVLVFILESALWNSGVQFWPNVAALDNTPYVFEDLIITLEATNGIHSDIITFPLSVVNFPVENYPPAVQGADDQLFHIGGDHVYAIIFVDPDCFIFSMSDAPATSHVRGYPFNEQIRNDVSTLRYQMTMNGLPNYQYGPWMETLIDPHSGLIEYKPKFEGAFDIAVTCTDDLGAMGFGEVTFFAVNPGTMLNHPPVIQGGPTQPVVLHAGEELILHAPSFNVEDPDGDELYASCNIGSCGHSPDGSFIWTFQTNFPGTYSVEIIFYDIRGGYAIMQLLVDVKPWWSYVY